MQESDRVAGTAAVYIARYMVKWSPMCGGESWEGAGGHVIRAPIPKAYAAASTAVGFGGVRKSALFHSRRSGGGGACGICSSG